MEKLLKFREWLTVPEAAQHLSIVCGEEVTESTILRLALDRHLTLSVNLVNRTYVTGGEVVGLDDVEWGEFSIEMLESLPHLLEKAGGKPLMYMRSLYIDEGRYLNLKKTVTSVGGVWDLPMIGAERLDIEHLYQQMTNGPSVTLTNLEGAFIQKGETCICRLETDFEDNEYSGGSRASGDALKRRIVDESIDEHEAKAMLEKHREARVKFLADRSDRKGSSNYFPAGGLPDDAVLVVRTQALREFEQSLNDNSKNDAKPLKTNERNTLLTIIAALCHYSDIDTQGRGAASQIARLTEEIGATITDDTVRSALGKIPAALDARSK